MVIQTHHIVYFFCQSIEGAELRADLPDYKSDDEIGLLIHSINDLKDNLIEQKVKNDKFVFWSGRAC